MKTKLLDGMLPANSSLTDAEPESRIAAWPAANSGPVSLGKPGRLRSTWDQLIGPVACWQLPPGNSPDGVAQ